MKRPLTLLVFIILSSCLALHAQNVGINTTGANADASSILDVSATDKGVLIPRVSLSDVSDGTAPVNAPATGLLVYNTNASVTGGLGQGFYYWSGTAWTKLTTGSALTLINTSDGITGGPISGSGTIGLTGQALALHNLNSDGFIVRTGSGTVAARSVATSGTGVTVTNGNGVSGNPTISLDYGSMATPATSGNPRPVGNFGQFQSHSAYNDFNVTPNYWGWNYIQGATNAPNATSSQWYRQNVSLGSEYPGRGTNGYSLELAYPRYNAASAGIWMRTVENGAIGSWVRIDAGAIGSGTTDYVSKWTSANTLGNSQIIDNGTNVGIGVAPSDKLHVSGSVRSDGVVYWGNGLVRTESRDDAGLQGNAGARSGFFETSTPTANWPVGASGWWHLLDVRHSNNGNNYAMQMAGSFFDQRFFVRKTSGSASTGWSEVVTNGENRFWTMSANFSHSPDDWCTGCGSTGSANSCDSRNVVGLGFDYVIEGVAYSTVTISANGWVAFGDQNPASPRVNECMPSGKFANPVIFGYWDDLCTNSGAGTRWGLVGASPNRVFIVDIERATTTNNRPVRFQIQIHENGPINVKYRHEMHNEANGQSATIGFQLHGGASAKYLSLVCNGKILDDNRDDSEGWSVSPIK